MFEFIKKFFHVNKKDKSTQKNNFMCSLNFELNYDGSINIVCYWPNFNNSNIESIDIVSDEYVSLLTAINSGALKHEVESTLNYLIEKGNLYDNIFIDTCLLKISEYDKKNLFMTPADIPLIKPSNVFRLYTTKQP
jgi:hypothetical protein